MLLSEPVLDLNAAQIHLWCVEFSASPCNSLLDRYRGVLSPQELQNESRFHFAKDRLRYLLTRALTRTVLSRYTALAPERLSFTYNAFGKPTLSPDVAGSGQLSFNISHTQSLIVLAVTHGGVLGVDVENIGSRNAPWEIADCCLSAEETSDVHALPPGIRNKRFFQHWTLKESYIKARGMGLSIPLDHFGFVFASDSVTLKIYQQLNDAASNWKFWQCLLFNDYLLAVCAERRPAFEQQLIFRKILPFVGEEAMDYQLICRSL